MRRHTDAFLVRRRRVAGLSLASVGAMSLVAAYQSGLLRHVPEPRLPWLDADRVDASPEAYELFRTPDAAPGLASYGVTLALAGAGTRHRAGDTPWLVVAMAFASIVLALRPITKSIEFQSHRIEDLAEERGRRAA